MNREEMIQRADHAPGEWDVIIIGGGATGVGCAIDAAARGYKTLLLEQSDFGKGTSSRSTKLAHGGVRYLRQGNLSLVLEALRERALMCRNAPHLVHNQAFVVPAYDWWEPPFYGLGLRLYDALAGRHGFGKSRNLSKGRTIELIPTIEPRGLLGGVIYYDGQFDDARLLINMAQTACERGAMLLNYFRVTELGKEVGLVRVVFAEDLETGRRHAFRGKVLINATGAFSDAVRALDNPGARPIITPSQGVHLVFDKSFLPGSSAIMVPHTADGRVLFAVPWHDRVVVGTTDTPVSETPLEPKPFPEEIDFILGHAARYLSKDPKLSDIKSAFAGLRPLVGAEDAKETSALSRDHAISISGSGLVTIAGGKWTTYRKMAEDTIDQAAVVGDLAERPSLTANLPIHGAHQHAGQFGPLQDYGSDAPAMQELIRERAEYSEPIHPEWPIVAGQVVWAVRREMARTVDDFLARRTRLLLLDARASIEAAPRVAELLARELGRNADWRDAQVAEFESIARNYLPEAS